jgi:hypothetical protein
MIAAPSCAVAVQENNARHAFGRTPPRYSITKYAAAWCLRFLGFGH